MIAWGADVSMGGSPVDSRGHALRATLAGDGSLGPIEIRIGRRLVELLEPSSREGRELLRSGTVELVGPGGENYGRVGVSVAWRRMGDRLEERLDDPAASVDEWLRASLTRLRALEASLDGTVAS